MKLPATAAAQPQTGARPRARHTRGSRLRARAGQALEPALALGTLQALMGLAAFQARPR